MSYAISLQGSDFLPERPFTDPTHTATDLAILQTLVAVLFPLAQQHQQLAGNQLPHIIQQMDEYGRAHRIVLIRPHLLLGERPLTLVGFFGQRRPQADDSTLFPLDDLLVRELPACPDLLSYSSMALANGDYANLVLFASPEGKQRWSESQTHARAVDLAPSVYDSVRIYNGRLPHGLQLHSTPALDAVKYFDYHSSPLWRAIRSLGQ
jgi:hypothetical protein